MAATIIEDIEASTEVSASWKNLQTYLKNKDERSFPT
jgi:hypothetical protein